MNRTLDEYIKAHFSRLSRQSLYAGISAFIVGLIAHLFILTNEFANHDDIADLWVEKGFHLVWARWLQSLCSPLVSLWGSGLMAGLFTLLILAISAILLVDTLGIKSIAMSCLIGAMMTASPIVACFMSYPNGSYQFAVGIPFAILAFRWYEKGIKGFIAAAVAIMFAIAGYQSNICITVACMYVILFCRLLEKNFDIKKWWKDFGKAFAVLITGLVLYIISMVVIAGITGANDLSIGVSGSDLEVEGYAAQTQTGTLYVSNIVSSVVVSIKYFVKYHFNIFFGGPNVSFASHVNTFANAVMALSLFYVIMVSIFKQKGIIRKIMIVAVALAMPMCINSTEIILNGKCHETLQMMYSMIIAVPLVVCVTERAELTGLKVRNSLILTCFIMLILHLYGNIQLINDAYQRMNSAYETAFSEMTRIIDRVEQTDEWQNGGRMLYFDYSDNGGYLINDNYQAMTLRDNYIDMGWMGIFGTGVYDFWGNKNTSNFVKCYLGVEFDTPEDDIIEKIKESDEYQTLEDFPSVNAIKVIDGVVVVRVD